MHQAGKGVPVRTKQQRKGGRVSRAFPAAKKQREISGLKQEIFYESGQSRRNTEKERKGS